MQRSLLLGLLILMLGGATLPFVVHASPQPPQLNQQPTYGLSSLDGGVQGFLQRQQSSLAKVTIDGQPAGQIIESMAAYYNIEARILVALLETTSQLISNPTLPTTATNQPFLAGPQGFLSQIDWAAREIRVGLGPYDSAVILNFSDGSQLKLDPKDDPHALTVKRFLAFERDQATWQQLVTNYSKVYQQLFQNEPVVAPSTPPVSTGFLSIPWEQGARMVHSSYFDHTYPMVDSGGDGNDVMINYQGKSGLSYNSHDGHDYYFPDLPYGTPIVAAAPGWAYARTTRGLGVLIQHAGDTAGYETVYWHLDDFAPSFKNYIDDSKPKWVERGELLGWSGATGFTDGAPHLHFEVRHNGKQVDPYGWYGPGSDPCTNYVKCEASVWLWNDSVPWSRPDGPAPQDTTPPSALLTINPDADLALVAQFENNPLPAVGPMAASDQISYASGKFGQAVKVGDGSLTYPASPTLKLEHGTLALWVKVPETWPSSSTGRHYLLAASQNPVDPAKIYRNTLALRHEQTEQAKWTFWTVAANGQEHSLSVPDRLSAGWHHFAISWNQTTGNKRLLIDGMLVSEASKVALPSEVGEDLNLGRWTIGAGISNVALDELLIYKRQLAADEIYRLAISEQALVASSSSTDQRDLQILTPALDNGGGVVKAQLGINGIYAAPMTYYRAYRWTLPNTEGSYTISVRLTDRMGNTSTLSQTIMIDHPPQASVTMRNLNALSATLVLSATDANQPLSMALSAYPNPTRKQWEPFNPEREWQWNPITARRVYVWFRDANGNERGPIVAGPDLFRAYLPRVEK
ncbi:peptidoglycan DD-metalloendopeptidase family protein [Herpetosiphon sp. NSE202]|uniref:peptidoglycan DD-metalloendopeptidase family protein n=1 Tax=Herpetosiphon sp. NSE202 TaxID=3351349 RepID=UPI003640B0BD